MTGRNNVIDPPATRLTSPGSRSSSTLPTTGRAGPRPRRPAGCTSTAGPNAPPTGNGNGRPAGPRSSPAWTMHRAMWSSARRRSSGRSCPRRKERSLSPERARLSVPPSMITCCSIRTPKATTQSRLPATARRRTVRALPARRREAHRVVPLLRRRILADRIAIKGSNHSIAGDPTCGAQASNAAPVAVDDEYSTDEDVELVWRRRECWRTTLMMR